MDILEAALSMIKPGCFIAVLWPRWTLRMRITRFLFIYVSYQKYLKFWFDGVFYQYACLPNGLASAFTKLPETCLYFAGYSDDSYLQGDTFGECHQNVINAATLFTKLGFHRHPEKSIFVPTQQLTILRICPKLDCNDSYAY